jgi:integrase
MLTAGGVLPPRDEELARTGQWLTGILEAAGPGAARRLVRAYATWQVMRRLRASAGRAARPRTCTAHARRNIRAAADFLAWLHSRGRAMSACTQADVDSWLATGPAACQARDFLSWAARHGHCPPFAVPGPVRVSGAAASQDERWALASRLLHDDALDLTDRAAGCLLLLCGQQLSRIAATTTSQITTCDSTVHIRFGDHDVPVPEPLGIVLSELIRNGRTHTGTGSPAATPWLFPGGLPGQPITAGRLGGRLRALGIYAATGRRAALLDLAAQLPAAVLADLLGLTPGTAVRWMRQAGADWSGYAAERHEPGITNPDQYPCRRTPRSTYSAWLVNRSLPVSCTACRRTSPSWWPGTATSTPRWDIRPSTPRRSSTATGPSSPGAGRCAPARNTAPPQT